MRVEMTVDYQGRWSVRASVAGFGQDICDVWASEYAAGTGPDPEDLVIVDPGNGFSYLFDLAGTLRGESCSRAARVVGVWGLSQTQAQGRDHSRMRGHPRPGRSADDRGHLISCAAGGGYDINLVPMDAALNRGWSPAGSRFRALERKAASAPGTLFFIRPVYQDGTDRPARFEAGVQDGENLLVDVFPNGAGPAVPMPSAALRLSFMFRLDATIIEECLDLASAKDRLFAKGWRSGPAGLTRAERCAVAGVTGHIAESVTEVLLDRRDWRVLWHFTGPGRHGVDLVFLTPDDKIVAVEVTGTLTSGHIPRLSRREMTQMSVEWVDKADNPGMAELGLRSAEIYGAVAVINFADMTWRIALTSDFSALSPVTHANQLTHLNWLAQGD
jgi:DNA/RNA non-specific endonuclease